MKLQSLKKYSSMKTVIDRCDATVLEVLEASRLREAKIAAESFRNGGKRLRPALMILSRVIPNGCPFDEVEGSLIDLAGAVELIHLATLFHDDVIDDVESRRMNVSARAKYGNHASVLTGDYALTEALLLVQRSGLLHTMPEFLRTIQVLVRGESRETMHKFDFGIKESTYFEIISEKSASLFALSCKVGGMSFHSEYADILGHLGWNLGMAFQLIDDLDDMLDLPDGPSDCDLKKGYFALPVIHALANLKDGHREGLIQIIRRGAFSPEEEKQIIALCYNHGGIQQTNTEIHRHLGRAAETLQRFEPTEGRDLLGEIIRDLGTHANTQAGELCKFVPTCR